MKKKSCFAIALAFCGAVFAQSADNSGEPDLTITPVCQTSRQCEAMWSAAQDAVGYVTGMRNRIATDSRIETYPPGRPSTLGGIVTKAPVGKTGYEVRLQIECYRNIPCDDLSAAGTKIFNRKVNQAGSGVQ